MKTSAVPCTPPSAMPYSFLHQRLLLYLLLIFILRVSIGASGVRVHDVKVPTPGVVGHPAQLECLWAAGAKGFYSVRWYKNGEQFYSFVPKNTPQVKVDHHLQGVTVELSHSNEHVVTLQELRMDSEGVYRCEVMSEAPTFQTSFASKNLTIVVMPEAPVLQGLQRSYRVGDTLNVTCSARDARPPATISFRVDGKLVHPGSGRVQELATTKGSYEGVCNTMSRLVLPLSERHVPSIRLVCKAQVRTLPTEIAATLSVDQPRTPILSFFNQGGSVTPVCLVALLLLAALTVLLTNYS
ncbi:uncharacterized protein [Panulirus ornatus]